MREVIAGAIAGLIGLAVVIVAIVVIVIIAWLFVLPIASLMV